MELFQCKSCGSDVVRYKSQCLGNVFCSLQCAAKDRGRKRTEKRKQELESGFQKCSHCKDRKPISLFYANASSSTGLGNVCKVCDGIKRNEREKARASADIRFFFKKTFKLLKSQRLKNGRECVISVDDLVSMWESQGGLCAITGEQMTHIRGKGKIVTNVSVDRIDSSKGYTKDNVHLVCMIVNFMKNSFSYDDLVLWANKIVDFSKQKAKHD